MSATPASASSTSGRVSTARCPVKVPREKEWVQVRAPRYGAAPDMGESMQRVGKTGGSDPRRLSARLRASAGPPGTTPWPRW